MISAWMVKGRTWRALCSFVLTAMAAGCGSAPKQDADAMSPEQRLRAALATGPSKGNVRRLVNAVDGLSVRKVIVPDSGGTEIGASLLAHAHGAAADLETITRLERNGLRLVRVPVDSLESMLAGLGGGPSYDVDEWRGQVLDWSPVLEMNVARGGQAVAVDGRVRRFERGRYRLMIRSWSLPMENGAFVNLELLPDAYLPGPSNDLRLAPDDLPRDQRDPLPGAGMELQMERGYAYVLVGERPSVNWSGTDAAAKTVQAQSAPAGRGRGPGLDDGPLAPTPLTLGELMLMTEGNPKLRGMLIFVPHVSDGMAAGYAGRKLDG